MSSSAFLTYVENELRARKYRPNTIDAYVRSVAGLLDYHQKTPPTDITNAQIKSYLESLVKRRKLSIATAHQAAHGIYRVYNDFLGKNYESAVLSSRARPQASEILTEEEVLALLNNTLSLKYQIAFGIIYSVGLDVTEATNIRITDIDLNHMLVRVVRTRGRGTRTGILSKYIATKIPEYLKLYAPEKWLLEGKDRGTQLPRRSILDAFKRSLKRAGIIKHVSVRTLKYSYVKHLERQGVPLWNILEELGMTSERAIQHMIKIGERGSGVQQNPLDLLMYPHVTEKSDPKIRSLWSSLHPHIIGIARSRFESGQYADAVEATLKAIEKRIRSEAAGTVAEGMMGASLMNRVFSLRNPILSLGDLQTESGRNIQIGYMQIFAGAMTGIRNPKAHDNLIISSERAAHLLFLSSLLMHKLDEAAK